MKTYLGVDVGTTGVKVSIFDVCGNLKSHVAARRAEGLKHIFAVPESAILNSGPSE
jgi:sugar (pentulose or hexulose) kinase